MKYIYKVEIMKQNVIFNKDNKKQEKQLNAAGELGWKLLLISEGKKFMKYVYVKEIQD
jgi:Zn/Cd-binding protein ZinT